MTRVVSESEFKGLLAVCLTHLAGQLRVPKSVTGPGRSGAIASVYVSHMLGLPWIPYGQPCPDKLRPLLIVDTARKTGATLRKAERLYGDGATITTWVLDEPPRVRFWYEREAGSPT